MNPIEESGKLFVQGFIKGLEAIDSSKFADGIVKVFSRVSEGIGKELTGKAFGAKIAEVAQEAIRSFRMGDIGAEFGNELGKGIKRFAYPAAMAIGDGFAYLARGIILKTMPYVFIATASVIGIPLTFFFVYYKAKHNIGRPALTMESRKKTIFTPLINHPLVKRITNVFSKTKKDVEAPIFNENITRRINEITKNLTNLQKNEGNLQNILLYGPPGTGKTMVVEKLLQDLDMDYIKMSGGDLPQYIKRGEHVTELNKLMIAAKNSSRPTILFIDEAEAFAKTRTHSSSDERVELLDAFLNHTGTSSKNFLIIMATNRQSDIDSAVLSRMDHKIQINPPELEERKKMVHQYAMQFFGKSVVEANFGTERVNKIAGQTDGFTGRTISKLMNHILSKKGSTEDNSLNSEMIDEAVDDFVRQEQEILL